MGDTPEYQAPYSTAEMLGRIDERTRSTATSVTELGKKVDDLSKRMTSVENTLENLKLVRSIVFGGVALILIALMSSVIAMVIVKSSPEKPLIQQTQ